MTNQYGTDGVYYVYVTHAWLYVLDWDKKKTGE